jgi:hypothetical protein
MLIFEAHGLDRDDGKGRRGRKKKNHMAGCVMGRSILSGRASYVTVRGPDQE